MAQRNFAISFSVVLFTRGSITLLAMSLLVISWTLDWLSFCLIYRPSSGVFTFDGMKMNRIRGP